jgi:enolase
MTSGSTIVSVTARQVFSERGHPGIEAAVKTENGAAGVALCTAGVSVGQHEVQFAYDGGAKWRGRGVEKAVENVQALIGPPLTGMDATRQSEIDDVLLNLGGPQAKLRLGGNATAAVSAAVLKAGAASLGIPLYQHIGGVNACTLPVPGEHMLLGGDRYGAGDRSGGKPSYSFAAYGFATFAEAAYAAWDITTEWDQVVHTRLGLPRVSITMRPAVPAGAVKSDREVLDLAVETICRLGYEGRVGFQVDVGASTYYDRASEKYLGIFSPEPKRRDDMIDYYRALVRQYPFVIIEDPLDEEDYEGHAILTRELGIQIVGDDLFTTDAERLRQGIACSAGNAVLLKVNQIGTISEALEMVRLAYRHGYGVMPCSSRGEGADIADYSVGLNCGTIRECATGPRGNRLLQIETELGKRAQFLGGAGIKGARFAKV